MNAISRGALSYIQFYLLPEEPITAVKLEDPIAQPNPQLNSPILLEFYAN